MNSYHDGDVYPVDVSITRTPSKSSSRPSNQASSLPSKAGRQQPATERLVTQAAATATASNIRAVAQAPVYLSDLTYHSQYDPTSLQYMLEFFRHVAQTIPQPSEGASTEGEGHSTTMPIEPMPGGNARDMLQDRAGIIGLLLISPSPFPCDSSS